MYFKWLINNYSLKEGNLTSPLLKPAFTVRQYQHFVSFPNVIMVPQPFEAISLYNPAFVLWHVSFE